MEFHCFVLEFSLPFLTLLFSCFRPFFIFLQISIVLHFIFTFIFNTRLIYSCFIVTLSRFIPAYAGIDSFLLNCYWYCEELQTVKGCWHQIYMCRVDIKLLERRLFCVSDGVGISSQEDWNGWASHFISCDISTEGILRYWLRSSQAKEYDVPVDSLSSEVWIWCWAELMRSLTNDSIKQLSNW